MWLRPSVETQLDAIELLVAAKLRDPPADIFDVETDRIYFVTASGKAKVAILHYSGGSRIVRSVFPGWPI